MHAICANEVTCAAPRCHQPGTVLVGCGPTHREIWLSTWGGLPPHMLEVQAPEHVGPADPLVHARRG